MPGSPTALGRPGTRKDQIKTKKQRSREKVGQKSRIELLCLFQKCPTAQDCFVKHLDYRVIRVQGPYKLPAALTEKELAPLLDPARNARYNAGKGMPKGALWQLSFFCFATFQDDIDLFIRLI